MLCFVFSLKKHEIYSIPPSNPSHIQTDNVVPYVFLRITFAECRPRPRELHRLIQDVSEPRQSLSYPLQHTSALNIPSSSPSGGPLVKKRKYSLLAESVPIDPSPSNADASDYPKLYIPSFCLFSVTVNFVFRQHLDSLVKNECHAMIQIMVGQSPRSISSLANCSTGPLEAVEHLELSEVTFRASLATISLAAYTIGPQRQVETVLDLVLLED